MSQRRVTCDATMKGLEIHGDWGGDGDRSPRPEEKARAHFRCEVENVCSRIQRMEMGQELDSRLRKLNF